LRLLPGAAILGAGVDEPPLKLAANTWPPSPAPLPGRVLASLPAPGPSVFTSMLRAPNPETVVTRCRRDTKAGPEALSAPVTVESGFASVRCPNPRIVDTRWRRDRGETMTLPEVLPVPAPSGFASVLVLRIPKPRIAETRWRRDGGDTVPSNVLPSGAGMTWSSDAAQRVRDD
jgi:hypothetical protein